MREFTDRVAVVTGAASGIGRALATRFAAAKMKVVLADVDGSALAAAEAEMKASGARVIAVRTDVSKAASVDALARTTLDAFGAAHVVCNNAGVSPEAAAAWEYALEDWQWTLGVNLWGVIHGIRSFLPIMLEQGVEGHVVNTASMGGLLSVPFGSVYHATKHAVVTISESVHYELEMTGAPVRVSVLCPGPVRTNIMNSERKRPPELRTQRTNVSADARVWGEAYQRFVAEGIPPADVADRVLEAIREEKFYILPHPETLEAVRARAQLIVEQANPRLFIPEETGTRFRL